MELKNKKFLVIGAGITGISIARLLVDNGAQYVKIIDIKDHIGGNTYDYKNENGFIIHKYGPHIFHTNYDEVIQLLSRFSNFHHFTHQVLVKYKNQLIPLPINETSIKAISSDKNIFLKLKLAYKDNKEVSIKQLLNNSDESIKQLGELIYKNFYENYTIKMWDITADKIDLNVLNRLKIVLSNEWNYFINDKFVGIPSAGWTSMMQRMLDHKNIDLYLNYSYKETYDINTLKLLLKNHVYDMVFYTGMIDELLDYKYGKLPYRSLDFKFEYFKDINDYQPASVVNYPADKTLTRITEYKKLCNQLELTGTVISKEYPGAYDINSKRFNLPYYPINNKDTLMLFSKYHEELKKIDPNFFVVGRLGQYKYFDTDDAVYNAIKIIKEICNKNE